jgi:phytoene synthase
MSKGDSIDYCHDLIARNDEDLRLSLSYSNTEDHARLAALFAFLIELRRIPSLVSEPPLGEIRLQWWREALDEIAVGKAPRAHPVVDALAESGAVTPLSHAFMEEMIDARARLLYERDFVTFDDLKAFLRGAEAPIVGLAAGDDNQDLDHEASKRLGEAYALARFAPGLTPQLSEAAAIEGRRLYLDHRHVLGGLPPRCAGRIAFLALTRGHAARLDGRPWPVAKRLSLFGAVLTGRF